MQLKKKNENIEFQAELYKFFDNFVLIQPKIHYMIQPKNYMLQPQNSCNAAQKAE